MNAAKLVARDSKGEVAVFRRDRNSAVLERASEDVRADLERWMAQGLVELVGPRRSPEQRVTLCDEPEFLDRVADRLRRYGFEVELGGG